MPTSEPESIVSVKLKKIEGEEKDCKDNDGRWQSWILSWDLFFVAFQGWDLLLELFDFLVTLGELEPLPYTEGEREEEDGADRVDVAEAGKDDVSQLFHYTFWWILSMRVLSCECFQNFHTCCSFRIFLKTATVSWKSKEVARVDMEKAAKMYKT